MTDLDQLTADVEQLREDVGYLTLLLEPTPATVQHTPPSTPLAAGHVWHTLTATQAATGWTQLTGWVDWLVDRYGLDDTLPACWYAHGALVDELDALRAAWAAAYLDPAARLTEPAYWLDLLRRALDRIREWDRYGCAAGTHHDDTPPGRDEHGLAAREEHVYADIQARATAQHRENGAP